MTLGYKNNINKDNCAEYKLIRKLVNISAGHVTAVYAETKYLYQHKCIAIAGLSIVYIGYNLLNEEYLSVDNWIFLAARKVIELRNKVERKIVKGIKYNLTCYFL